MSKPKEPELKPCPFCGGKAKLTVGPVGGAQVRCGKCKARGPLGRMCGRTWKNSPGQAEQERFAVGGWNARPEAEALRAAHQQHCNELADKAWDLLP